MRKHIESKEKIRWIQLKEDVATPTSHELEFRIDNLSDAVWISKLFNKNKLSSQDGFVVIEKKYLPEVIDALIKIRDSA